MSKKKPTQLVPILLILFVCIASDQATKVIAQDKLKGVPPTSYLADTFRLGYAENPGAFLSLGARLPEELRFWLLTALVGVFLVIILFYLISSNKALTKIMVYSLSLMVGGGISNLIDRMFRENHAVIDFMNMGIGSLRTGVFNVADVAIMAGVGLLLLDTIKMSGKKAPSKSKSKI